MKRFFSGIMLFLYLTVSVGFTVQLHWCGSKLSAWSIENISGKSCACEDEKTEKKCHSCKSTEASFKLNVVHSSNSPYNLIVYLPLLGELYGIQDQKVLLKSDNSLASSISYHSYRPPILESICCFLI